MDICARYPQSRRPLYTGAVLLSFLIHLSVLILTPVTNLTPPLDATRNILIQLVDPPPTQTPPAPSSQRAPSPSFHRTIQQIPEIPAALPPPERLEIPVPSAPPQPMPETGGLLAEETFTPPTPVREAKIPRLPFVEPQQLDRLAKQFTQQNRRNTLAINTEDLKYFSYLLKIKSKIESLWSYPLAATQQGIEGNLLVHFIIDQDGRVNTVEIIVSSGHDLLDREAVRAVEAASPFTPLPPTWDQNQLVITGHFIYHGNAIYLR